MSKQFMVLSPSHNESDLKHTNYIVEADVEEEEPSFDDIWNSEKHWFDSGATVTIQNMGNMEYQTYYIF